MHAHNNVQLRYTDTSITTNDRLSNNFYKFHVRTYRHCTYMEHIFKGTVETVYSGHHGTPVFLATIDRCQVVLY